MVDDDDSEVGWMFPRNVNVYTHGVTHCISDPKCNWTVKKIWKRKTGYNLMEKAEEYIASILQGTFILI